MVLFCDCIPFIILFDFNKSSFNFFISFFNASVSNLYLFPSSFNFFISFFNISFSDLYLYASSFNFFISFSLFNIISFNFLISSSKFLLLRLDSFDFFCGLLIVFSFFLLGIKSKNVVDVYYNIINKYINIHAINNYNII